MHEHVNCEGEDCTNSFFNKQLRFNLFIFVF